MPTSIHYSILTAVRDTVRGLDLVGITDANCAVTLLPLVDRLIKANSLKLPAVVISPVGSELMTNATNDGDDVGYPVTVAIVQSAEAADLQTNLQKYLYWREAIRAAFSGKRLEGVGTVWTLRVEPAPVVSLDAWINSNLFVSGLIVRAISREQTR